MLAALGVIFLAAGVLVHVRVARPEHQAVLTAGDCHLPITIIEPAARGGDVTAIVFHGLSANRRLMDVLGQSLAWSDLRVILVDFPGHGDNTDAFSIERCEECAGALLDTLVREGQINPDRTILIGHSLGGAIAIRMADWMPVAATIAISPAPMVPRKDIPDYLIPVKPPRRRPANLLVIMGESEPKRFKQAAAELIAMAGGERHELEDFRQRRAARLIVAPYASHTSLLFNRFVWDVTDVWWRMAAPIPLPTRNFLGYVLAGGMLAGLVGLGLLFALGLRLIPAGPAKITIASPPSMVTTLGAWLVAAAIGGGLTYLFVPLAVLRIYSGDVLASVMLVAGIVVAVFVWRRIGAQPFGSAQGKRAASLRSATGPAEWLIGVAAGMFVVLALGAWLNWQVTDLWMTAGRWWRFAVLVPLMLPYALAEELTLAWPGTARRYLTFFVQRVLLLLAVVLPFGGWHIDRLLILLLLPYLVIFSLGQRLGADAVRRHSGSATAAAIFGAILAAWFLAGVFPVTGS